MIGFKYVFVFVRNVWQKCFFDFWSLTFLFFNKVTLYNILYNVLMVVLMTIFTNVTKPKHF